MSEYFGRYRLVQRIGGGSLGEVFAAQHRDAKVVALKRLAREHLASSEHAAALRREGAIAERMQHERLLGSLESGEIGGWPFFSQQLARDGALFARLRPALPQAQLRLFARDLWQALQAVHDAGYVHGDLSPSNFLFDKDRARLTDFGAAVELGAKQAQPAGTYAFMSPEQVKGEPLSAASDVFSAAILLWLCATGERIFARNAPHLCFMAVVNDEPPAMPASHAALDKALRPALHKGVNGRCSDIQSLSDSFDEALRTLPPQP